MKIEKFKVSVSYRKVRETDRNRETKMRDRDTERDQATNSHAF